MEFTQDQLAVIREMVNAAHANESAATREQMQRVRGEISQLLRDYGSLRVETDTLKRTVFGDSVSRFKGLVDRFDALEKTINDLVEKLESWTNQGKGFRIAFVAIGLFTSIPAFQIIGKFLGVIP